jgi:hypothetical protein
MKSLLLALTFITLTLLSCSKKDDVTPVPDTSLYEGTWSGTFSGDSNGTFITTVSGVGTVKHNYIGPGGPGDGTGTLTESGKFNIAFSNGGQSTGQLNAETGVYTGTWSNADNTLRGTSIGTKD